MLLQTADVGNPNNAGTLRPEDIALLRSAEESARLRMERRTYSTPTVQPIAPVVRAVVQRILSRQQTRGAA